MSSLVLMMFLTAEGKKSHWLTPDALAKDAIMTCCATHKRPNDISRGCSLSQKEHGSTLAGQGNMRGASTASAPPHTAVYLIYNKHGNSKEFLLKQNPSALLNSFPF